VQRCLRRPPPACAPRPRGAHHRL